MSEIEIIGAPQSNFVRSVRMACVEKGVPYRLTPARPHSPEIDAIHPFGLIPAMRHGELTLCESRAIAGYVDQAFAGPALLPRDPKAAAVAEQWCSLVAHAIDGAMMRGYAIAYFFPGTADGKPDRARVEASLPKLKAAFVAVEARLAASAYLGGPAFGLADMLLLPMIQYMRMLPESGALLAESPALTAWFDNVSARPSAVETLPPERR